MSTVAIVGGGISGLTIGYELLERAERLPAAPEIVCYESGPRTGGNVRSDRLEGFLCEWGPNGFLDNVDTTLTLVRRLGLTDRQIQASNDSDARYVFRSGKLRKIPTGPQAFLTSDVLSIPGKLRLLFEPFVRGRSGDAPESVHAFASRRIGREAASVLVDAMVSGIFAGSSSELSLPATFPRMREMERQHGSLFRAMLARRKAGGSGGGPAGPGGRLTSFREGTEELTGALTARLGSRVQLNTPVIGVSDMGVRGFRIHFEEGAPRDVAAVVVACPAWHAASMVSQLDAELAAAIGEIPGAPLAVIHTGHRDSALGDFPEGFGFLVPRGQGPRILGTIFSSNIFEGRAPSGNRLLTTMVGGAHDPAAVELGDEELLKIVREDHERCLGIVSRPWVTQVLRHPHGIPQYTLGHRRRLAAIDARLAEHPGLWLTGNSYHGVSLNACIEEAPRVAEALLEFLAKQGQAAVNS